MEHLPGESRRERLMGTRRRPLTFPVKIGCVAPCDGSSAAPIAVRGAAAASGGGQNGGAAAPSSDRAAASALLLLLSVAIVALVCAPASAAVRGDPDEPRGSVIVTDVKPEVDDVSHVAAGADGTVWFTCTENNRIGRVDASGAVTTFADPRGHVRWPAGLTAGSDGNIWFVSFDNDRIGRITPSGEITTFNVPGRSVSLLGAITTGPDGNVWFTMRDAIGRVTPTGAMTTFKRPGVDIDMADAITPGPDGNIWFTASAWRNHRHPTLDQIGRITPAGDMRMFSDPRGRVRSPGGIAAGADGNLWFVSRDNNRIGRITPSGRITTRHVPLDEFRGLEHITAGSDGNLWFTSSITSSIGRIIPSTGQITAFSDVDVTLSNDAGIATGPDGNLWFAEYYRVTRVTPSGVFTRFPR